MTVWGLNRHRSKRSRRRAVILVLTLWIVLVLTLMAQSLVFEMRVEMKLSGVYRDQLIAEQLARIGLARAVADLRNDYFFDRVKGVTETRPPIDTLADCWALGGEEPFEFEPTPHEGRRSLGVCRVMVIDEESKIGLNGFESTWVPLMTNLLRVLEVDEKDAADLAQAMWDWKDADDSALGVEGETEREFYAERAAELEMPSRSSDPERPFYFKNAPFESLDELSQIPGVTPTLFYGYDPEETPDPEFFPLRSFEEGSDRRPGLRDLVTLRGSSLNMNTASYECLAAVCAYAMDDLDNGCSLAQRIVEYRQGKGQMHADEEDFFRRERDFEKVEGLIPPVLAKMKQVVRLTTFSSFFTIYSEGRSGAKKESFASSLRDRRSARPVTRARIVAECLRSGISPKMQDLQGTLSEEVFQKVVDNPNLEKYSIDRKFCIPAVYFKRWVSY
ncbi:general secretion pathway protein GspK [Candidatus Sumerlaeota bacterium]|nr:general secretion pathway protein GspK [Candidatus Sumerlaeota bacterium]